MWGFLQAVLLIVNSLAILNEERFLVPYGWGFQEMSSGRISPLKAQIIGLLHAVQYLRVPLIGLNVITIVFKLLFA
ncbi:unnamed protein product [Closterium sp. NIES-64]|nr:hypothetical protein CLOM_g17683 [Closterium sp. NIES-68]CAI5513531.1 unnamed protein product [Closterium sp. Naga37s-1]CAI5520006.1 unnamed protein product [Closterium sp. Naga37s-1]CAI5972760.1 unnamed protein product [Closterium sp. NIES-64]